MPGRNVYTHPHVRAIKISPAYIKLQDLFISWILLFINKMCSGVFFFHLLCSLSYLYIYKGQLNERNLLSSVIIKAIMSLWSDGLWWCAETETLPACHQSTCRTSLWNLLKLLLQNPKHLVQPVVDEQAVFGRKWMSIKCYNKLLVIPVQRSLARYADWLKDFKQAYWWRAYCLWHLRH